MRINPTATARYTDQISPEHKAASHVQRWALFLVFLVSCSSGDTPGAGPPTTAGPMSIDTVLIEDAPRVAITQRFISAFNAREKQALLGLLSENPIVSDCNYQTGSVAEYRGRPEVGHWLDDRFADHDQMVPAAISNTNPDPTSAAIGVAFARRTSDTLRRLGFTRGITPRVAAKLRFVGAADGLRIDAFANAPIGGPVSDCIPRQ